MTLDLFRALLSSPKEAIIPCSVALHCPQRLTKPCRVAGELSVVLQMIMRSRDSYGDNDRSSTFMEVAYLLADRWW